MQPGTVVAGRYRIEAHLASGGMGAVYRARHTLAERAVALKILRPTSMGMDVADVRRFRREATAPARIGHPGIVEVLDAGVEEGLLFLVMELLEGESLRARRRHATRAELLGWIRALLEPLAAAHDEGFVHRDLKPENVFLARTADGERLKLLDFGIARSIGGPSDTRTGTGLGTPGYMAPEQALEARGAAPAADVWSVGVMIYETVTGVRPFEGETPHATVLKAVSEDHVPLTGVAPELAALVDACLAKRPVDRPRDARALMQRLDALPPDALALDGVRLGPDELATDPDHAPTSPAAVEVDATGFPLTRQVTAPVSSPPPTSETPVGRLTPRTRSTRTGVRVGAAALGVLGLTVVGWVAVRGTEAAVEEDVESPPRLGRSPGVDAAFEPDAAVANHASIDGAELAGVVRVADHDRRFSLRLPRGWSEVDSPVPTVAAAMRAGETVGSFAPSANLVIEPFDGDTRAFVALGLQNAAPVSTTHGQRVMELRGAPAVRVTATFRGERPYRAFTYANVLDGVGVVLACYADPEHAEEVEPTCDRIAASLTVD